jgi:hypothetical protein
LGYLPARIGGFGLALAHDACRHARALFAEAVAYDQQRPTDAEAAAAFEKKHVPRLRDAETKLKELATEAANVLEDALEHAPPFKLLRQPPVWNEVLHSKYTQQMKAQVDAQLGLPAAAGITEPALPIEPPQLDSTLLQAQLDEERQAPLRQLASLARSLLASLRKLPGPAQQGAADAIIRAAVLPEDDELRELRRLAANIGPALAQQAQAVTDNFGWLLQWARQWGFRWTEAEQALKKLGAT